MGFMCRTMLGFARSIWVLACEFVFYLFGVLVRLIDRLKVHDSKDGDQIDSANSSFLEPDGFSREENADFYFGFHLPNSEDYNSTTMGETEDSLFQETSPSQNNTSKYQVLSGKNFSGFMEEPETVSFTIQEMFVGSSDSPEIHLEEAQNQKSLVGSETEAVIFEKAEDSVQISDSETILEKPEEQVIEQDPDGNQLDNCNFSNDFGLISDIQFSDLESEPESSSSSEAVSISNPNLDSIDSDFFSNGHVGEGVLPENLVPMDDGKAESIEKKSMETSFFDREAEDTDDEYTEFEPILPCSNHLDRNFPTTDFEKIDSKSKEENLHNTETEAVDSLGKSWGGSDLEDEDGFDVVLKHQELIEQMKMEMKNSRNRGLPTILEDSETPKILEDLKPLEIDEKLEHKDRVEEIQKVYKSYAEKMRKLDVLNYQTMHAISFLQLKDPNQQPSSQKSSVSAIKSFLLPNFWPCKLRRIYADPTRKSINELHRDLEMVYVGQLCLSWEILHWQYGKARELLEHDFDEHHTYIQVASEFQQFQVLVQRFVENEPFQGPRVQNYAKNRFELRTLLQVPIIKDDCLKDKESGVEGEKSVVSVATLAEIIHESMGVFWEFLHADKDEASILFKGLQASHVDLQDSSNSELLMDIKTSLQKKERRLKDVVRSGNCIVKKFQKHHQGGRMDRAILFAQIELKLVARVLRMSRLTTDQLVWCQKKLNRINIINRKIHVEPSFLLFPF